MLDRLPSPAELAADIRRVAQQARSEEDLRIGVEKLLDPFLERYGIRRSRYETATRADAQHGNLFIEYKRPGKLLTESTRQECIEQLQKHLLQEASRHGAEVTTLVPFEGSLDKILIKGVIFVDSS